MKITTKDVEYIAKLSNLSFTDDEAEKMAEEFSNILTHFDIINKENLEGIEMYSFDDEPLRLRKDEIIKFENSEDIFKNSKDMTDNYIKIPKIIE